MSAIDMLPSIGIAMLGVFVSAVAQVLLKKEALVEHDRVIDEYLNARVVVAFDMLPSIGIAMLGVFVSAVAQVLLKKEALVEHDRVIDEYLNARVVVASLMMLASTLMLVFALRVIPVTADPIIEATSYVYVTIFGVVIFKERVNRRKTAALALILLGIFIYALGL